MWLSLVLGVKKISACIPLLTSYCCCFVYTIDVLNWCFQLFDKQNKFSHSVGLVIYCSCRYTMQLHKSVYLGELCYNLTCHWDMEKIFTSHLKREFCFSWRLLIGVLSGLYCRFWNKWIDMGNFFFFHFMFHWCICIQSGVDHQCLNLILNFQRHFEYIKTHFRFLYHMQGK